MRRASGPSPSLRGGTSARFRASLAACHVAPGSRAGRAVGTTLAALSDAETLPEPDDETTLLEPEDERGVSSLGHVRRVKGHNLWVWYRVSGTDVVLVQVTRLPPKVR